MHMTPHEEAARWLAESTADLDTARYLAEGRRFNTACFIAQQAFTESDARQALEAASHVLDAINSRLTRV